MNLLVYTRPSKIGLLFILPKILWHHTSTNFLKFLSSSAQFSTEVKGKILFAML